MNFLGGISTTGGTGTLTISQGLGLALPASALEDDEEVPYSIVQRASSTDRTVVQAESGIGTVSSSNVLTRDPRVTYVASGPTYDQDGTVSALNFGTSDVEVYFGPVAESLIGSMPQRAKVSDTYGSGPNEWIIATNYSDATDFSTHTLLTNNLTCVPMRIEAGFAITTMGVKVSTAQASKSVSIAIATIKSASGVPGRIVACVNDLSVASTGVVSGSCAARMIRPGWYYGLVLSDASTAVVRGSASPLPNFLGALASADRSARHWYRSKTFATTAFAVGADAMSGSSGSPIGVYNLSSPIILLR